MIACAPSLRCFGRIAAALAAACVVTLPAAAADRALIVGINKFSKMPPESQLNASVNDARRMEALLREQWGFKPENIKLLIDEQGTAANIKAEIRSWLVDGTGPGDRVFFYYSGHGYFVPDKDGDEPDGKDEALAVHDAELVGSEFKNMVTDDDIHNELVRMKDRSVMVVVDSCHSGTITRALNPMMRAGSFVSKSARFTPVMRGTDKSVMLTVDEAEFTRLRRGSTFVKRADGVLAWTAVSPTEIAQEDVNAPDVTQRNGVFTLAFDEGIRKKLADADGNGVVSAAELLQYVRSKAKTYCETSTCQTGMTPTFEPGADALSRDMLTWTGGGGTPPGPTPPGPISPTDILPVTGAAFQVTAEMLPGPNVRLGDEIKIKVSSSKAGYLIVLDVREDGKVVQLFPSTCAHPERTLRANAALTLPDPTYGCVFTATEPGRGQIVAVVAQDNVPLEALLLSNKGLEVIANPSAYLGQVAQALLGVWTGDDRNRPVNWGIATARYEIK